MKTFLKIFALVIVLQIVFIAQMFITGLGDGIAYFLYGTPFMVLASIVGLPKQPLDESSLGPVILLFLPGIFYALAIAGISVLIRRIAISKA